MASKLYPLYLQRILGAGLDLSSLDVRAVLVDLADYTYSDAHEFLSDVAGAARVAVTGALGSKTITNGIFDAADSLFPTATGDPSEAVIFYQHTGSDATARLIKFNDGRFRFKIAVNASGGVTSLTVDPLLFGIPNAAVATKISGTGDATLTLTAQAAAGARSITVSTTSGATNAEAVYEVAILGSGLPITPNGNDINLVFDSGTNRIFNLQTQP